jgi:non-specific serine/threonine protein kinase/serine/threonine-protein kinase
MNDADGAAPLLRGYLKSNDVTPAARAQVSGLLAQAELQLGNKTEARRLLDAAQAFWNENPEQNRKALVEFRLTQALIEKEESGLPTSIRTMQLALLEHDDYYGRNAVETAVLLNSLGIAYQANGDIDKADAAFRDSWKVYEKLGSTRSAGALLVMANWTTVAYRKNDFARAEELLLKATKLRSDLYGPSAALASMQGNLGKIMLKANRPKDALVQLDQALPMTRKYTGEHSTLTTYILQSIAEAYIQLGELQRAGATERLCAHHTLFGKCSGITAQQQFLHCLHISSETFDR